MTKDIDLETLEKAYKESAAQKAREREARDQAKKEGAAVVDVTKAPPVMYRSGEEEYFSFLVPHAHGYGRATHKWNNDTKSWVRFICSEHYGEECPHCVSTTSKSGKQHPFHTWMSIVHSYNAQAHPDFEVDVKDKDGKPTGEKKKMTRKNFAQRLEYDFGKDKANYNVFKAAAAQAEELGIPFEKMIFKVKYTKGQGGGWSVPVVATQAELKEKFGPDFSVVIPEAEKAYGKLTHRELKKLYLSDWGNKREDILLGPEPSATINADNPFESKVPEVNKKSKEELPESNVTDLPF